MGYKYIYTLESKMSNITVFTTNRKYVLERQLAKPDLDRHLYDIYRYIDGVRFSKRKGVLSEGKVKFAK